jgi:uncharacterized membrane protein
MSLLPEEPPYVYFAVPNRSLGRRERFGCIMALAATTFVVAAAAAMVGAWPVVPFAGIEVALVVAAFRILSRHDGDFERLEISGARIRFQARQAARVTQFEGHASWARLVVRSRPGRCELGLRYAGRTVEIGRLLTDERRWQWAAELGRRLPVTSI